ncbi:PREDICTED: probable E3 ubiquitin-protein ligase RHG1A isoform X1 [Camelina sativa]|uniref:RING-type E3 ubiquitin transferase n=1 Tax=Camelina sativa TaxID=90675 RepID=A0ABM0SU71_CAMSA|nr:PREDICTED: probable E3 ubiquitin-protein ligase RHG1A isoform X1 [Camelina sativa]
MPVSAEPSSTTIGQHIKLQRPRNHRNLQPTSTADEPLLPKPSSRVCKSAMSSFFLLPTTNETTRKKPNGFTQTASFRALGCTTSASQHVSVPAVIRSSADWDANSSNHKIKKTKKKKNKNKGNSSYNGGGSIKILSESTNSSSVGCAAIPDVWCGPGVGFSTDAVVSGSVETVESDPPRRNIPVRRKIDGDNKTSHNQLQQREVSSLLPIRSLNQESNPYFDSDSTFLTSRAEQSDRYHRHLRQPYYPDGLAELQMMMLQNGFVMGGVVSSYDRFRDLRLNVDNMTYEQLLELGDRIGYVKTGLNEKQIKSCLRKVKPFRLDTPVEDRKCIICQDEYEVKDEVGKLKCGHRFHIHCVKQWLVRKNSCPVCKTMPYVKS